MSAVGSAMLQQTTGAPMNSTSLVVPLVSAVIGAAMSYAMLKTTVARMQMDVRDMRKDMGEIYDLLRENAKAVAHLEGRLSSHS
jgi:3-dehydroquinate dehydratase